MKKIKLPMFGARHIRRYLQQLTLTFSIVGLLVLAAGAFGPVVSAGQGEDLRASLSELLFKAVTANDINAVRTVVEAGADLSRVNMNGQTAMDIAVDRSHFDIAQYLVLARRIEQQTTMKAVPPVATVHQVSPEAAPDVVAARPNAPAPKLAAKVLFKTPAKTPGSKTLPQKAAKILAAEKRPTAPVADVQLAKAALQASLKPTAAVYIIGPNGNLVQATPAQIQRAQQAIQRRVAKTALPARPDVEPRKSFFMPRPRIKPPVKPMVKPSNHHRPLLRQAALPKSQIPKTSTPRIEVPGYAKPAIPRITDGRTPRSVRIRPTRRISPKLLDKLRRRLRTTDHNKNAPTALLDAPKVLPPSLPRAVESAPLPAPEPRSHKAPNNEVSGTMGKLLTGLGRLLGLENPQNAEAELVEEHAEIEITPAQPRPPQVTLQQQVQPQSLPQNSTPGFVTRNNAPPAKIAVEVALASPRIQLSPKPQKSASIPTAKAPTSGVLERVKEVFLPGAVSQPKVDASISETANEKIQEASSRRLTRAMPLNRLRKPLKNILLTLGDSVTTGQTKLPRGIAEPDACVRKRRGSVSFCIVPVDWPRAIEPAFSVNTSLYQGTRAIARYDNGKASHYHALYASADHDKIIQFMKQRYGPPTDIWKRMIAPFGKPRQPNPTYVWRSHDSETDQVTILEVRKFDDSRSVFPDISHGAIRLYPAGGPPVFPIITAHDIMSIEWAARSDHIDGASPALARTIRVQP